ncbi:MAG: glycoside hydrolase family 3 C-terminal domain-containing protein, partial [Patescibacteria group bacterium]|nr:glycoside hydrolase family 3 C-terminal domain-containing protein [Patescibacteria group bacterium]
QWGSSSNKNFKIDQGTTKASEKTLREFYLPPFQAAVDAGVFSVMVGLNSWGNQKISTHEYLITDILKEELGFKGFVVSDWYGVYEIPGGEYAAVVTAINAGIDMVMLPYDYKTFIKNVEKAVRKGDISKGRIDDAVVRILRAKFSVGLFEKISENSLEMIGSDEHRALAREAVSKSVVLLKNENKTLPLSSDVKRIFVAGSAAHNTGKQSGAWTIEWQGIDGNAIPGATSILEGIEESAGSDTQIVYDANARFTADENMADVGIAVVGEKPYAEGWGDNENPVLSPEDLEVISSLRKVSKKIIVIIVSGRPLFLPDEMEQWDAIIAAWLPGTEGAGVAPVLFGRKPFDGKLPLPWPANRNQLPFSPDGKSSDKTEPLFPKGFGL